MKQGGYRPKKWIDEDFLKYCDGYGKERITPYYATTLSESMVASNSSPVKVI